VDNFGENCIEISSTPQEKMLSLNCTKNEQYIFTQLQSVFQPAIKKKFELMRELLGSSGQRSFL
jgi:hypothetical protein